MLFSQSTAKFFTGLAVSSDAVAYSLANNGTALVKYHVQTPYKSTLINLNAEGNSFSALDFRPATGQLYGYSDATDSYSIIDVNSGNVTLASGNSVAATNTSTVDIDWNPTIDRLRTVTETDQNIVYNPVTGEASNTATTNLFYALGDVQAGSNPAIVANAYTNNVAGATTTQQFALDHVSNTLVTLANNAGTLNTVGTLTLDDGILDFGANAGFDIVTDMNGNNTAYATLMVGGDTGLYMIDLNTAETTLLGVIENDAVSIGLNGGTFSSLGLDGNAFGIMAGSDFAASLGLAS